MKEEQKFGKTNKDVSKINPPCYFFFRLRITIYVFKMKEMEMEYKFLW